MEAYVTLRPLKTSLSFVIAFILFFSILSISNDDMLNLSSLIISYISGIAAITCIYFFLEKNIKQNKWKV